MVDVYLGSVWTKEGLIRERIWKVILSWKAQEKRGRRQQFTQESWKD